MNTIEYTNGLILSLMLFVIFYMFQAPVGRIFFTGEHTSERFNGYVHGGYLAGEDVISILY